MNSQTVKKIHKTGGVLALVVILVFFSFSLSAELTGNHETIKAVKTGILYGMVLLFAIMPATVLSGRKIAGHSKSHFVEKKLKRMRLIAADAIILIILAVTLYIRAIHDKIDGAFIILQLIEFTFGLLNVVFLLLMIRDGRKLAIESEK